MSNKTLNITKETACSYIQELQDEKKNLSKDQQVQRLKYIELYLKSEKKEIKSNNWSNHTVLCLWIIFWFMLDRLIHYWRFKVIARTIFSPTEMLRRFSGIGDVISKDVIEIYLLFYAVIVIIMKVLKELLKACC